LRPDLDMVWTERGEKSRGSALGRVMLGIEGHGAAFICDKDVLVVMN